MTSFQVRAPWGGVTANGNVAFDASGSSRVQADISGVDAGSLMRSLELAVCSRDARQRKGSRRVARSELSTGHQVKRRRRSRPLSRTRRGR